MINLEKSDTFARRIEKSPIRAESGNYKGLRGPWADSKVEAAVHDVAHAVTLGVPIEEVGDLGRQIDSTLKRMKDRHVVTNEARTLAAEYTFFKNMRAFTSPEDGWGWLYTTARETGVRPASFHTALRHPMLKVWVRRLRERLIYHTRNI